MFFAAVAMTTASRQASACTLALPEMCKPVLHEGAKVPTNAPGLFVFHGARSGDTTAALTPPVSFYQFSLGDEMWSFNTYAASNAADALQRSPLFVVPLPAAPASLGATGKRTVDVPACDPRGNALPSGTQGSSRRFTVNITPSAAFPSSVEPEAATVSFGHRAKNNGANCGGPTDEISVYAALTLPADVLPWLDIMQWSREETARSADAWVSANVLPDHTGISLYASYACSDAARTETWNIRGAIPGLAPASQPAGASVRIRVPPCSTLPAAGVDEVPLDLDTGENSAASATSTTSVGGGSCSLGPSQDARAAFGLVGLLGLVLAGRGRKRAAQTTRER